MQKINGRSKYVTVQQQLHHAIVKLIKLHGLKFFKKHGNWYKLELGPGHLLQLDSWNSQIKIIYGSGNYNEWLGFENKDDKQRINIGMDWGGFCPHITTQEYMFLYAMVKSFFFTIEE